MSWEQLDQRPKVKSDNERCEYPTRCKHLVDGYCEQKCLKYKMIWHQGMFYSPFPKCKSKDCKEK